MSKIVQYPEKLDSKVDFLNVGIRKAKLQQKTLFKRKQYWEQEEKLLGLSVPTVSSLPSSASNGDVVYCNGLYIYNNGWQRIDQDAVQATAVNISGSVTDVVLLPEAEAVYSSRTGGGSVYVAVTNSGRMRSLVFDAQSQPTSDASATFAMTAGLEESAKYKLLVNVRSNQANKTFSFRIFTDNAYNVVVAVNSYGLGSQTITIGGAKTITVTRVYTQESGISYPCWTACSFVISKQ
jgi:hypothetical protein